VTPGEGSPGGEAGTEGERSPGGESRPGDKGGLARGYRRLLRWYPEGHRARHGEEMLAVLLAAAPDGQRRPGARESANLIAGALKIRLRAATIGSAPLWRDALARAGILLPLAMLAQQLVLFVLMFEPGQDLTSSGIVIDVGPSLADEQALSQMFNSSPNPVPVLLLVILLPVLLLAGRRVCLAAAVAVAVLESVVTAGGGVPLSGPQGSPEALAGLGIVILALAAGPGPRRARGLLRWWHYPLAVAAAGAVEAVAYHWQWAFPPNPPGIIQFPGELGAAAVAAVIAAVLLAVSPASRRLLGVISLPLYYLVALDVAPLPGPASDALATAPLVPLLAAAVLLTRRRAGARGRRPAGGSPAGGSPADGSPA